MKGETFNAQRSISNAQPGQPGTSGERGAGSEEAPSSGLQAAGSKPVRDLHECAARSAAEHAEFQAFYREHVMGSQVIHELVGRYAWAAIEKAAWLAWKHARKDEV